MPTPAAVSAAITSTWPSSLRLTEAMAGASHQRIAATRALRSGTIHAPVETPTGTPGHAACTARTARLTVSVSRPSSSRGWMCRAWAPAATAAAPSAASWRGVSGSARCSLAARAPFRHALIRPTGSPLRGLAPGRGGRGRGESHRNTGDRARQRDEVLDADALVDGMGELDARRAGHHRGDPACRPQAHVGAPRDAGERGLAAQLGAQRLAHERRERVVRASVSPEANCPPRQPSRACGQAPATAASTPARGGRDVLAHAHRRAALEAQPVGDAARPLPRLQAPDEQRVRAARARASAGARRRR